MAEMPDVCEKAFHPMLQKLVDCNHITSSVADEVEKEYRKFLYKVVKENKTYFRESDKSNDRLDGFFMTHMSDSKNLSMKFL